MSSSGAGDGGGFAGVLYGSNLVLLVVAVVLVRHLMVDMVEEMVLVVEDLVVLVDQIVVEVQAKAVVEVQVVAAEILLVLEYFQFFLE